MRIAEDRSWLINDNNVRVKAGNVGEACPKLVFDKVKAGNVGEARPTYGADLVKAGSTGEAWPTAVAGVVKARYRMHNSRC